MIDYALIIRPNQRQLPLPGSAGITTNQYSLTHLTAPNRLTARPLGQVAQQKPLQPLAVCAVYRQLPKHRQGAWDYVQKRRIQQYVSPFCAGCQLLLAQKRLQNIQVAKKVLKQCEKFISLKHYDAVMTSVAINNLALIYLKQKKFNKSAALSLKAMGPMLSHMRLLQQSKHMKNLQQSKQIHKVAKEDAIILISLAATAQKSLRLMIGEPDHNRNLKTIFRMVNQAGFFVAKKYLNQGSNLAKQFMASQESINLPIYLEPQTMVKKVDQRTEFENKVMAELEQLYKLVKEYKVQPQVYYINHYPAAEKEQTIKELPPPQPAVEDTALIIEDKYIEHVEEIVVNGWEVQIQMLKQVFNIDNNGSLSKSKICSRVQSSMQYSSRERETACPINFIYKKANRTHSLLLEEEKTLKLISVINVCDVLPYQFDRKNLKIKLFLKYVLPNFIFIDQHSTLQLYPKAVPLIEPFQIKFGQTDCFIFLNHVRYNQFRIAICPCLTQSTLYLDIQFKNRTIYNAVSVQDLTNLKIVQICRQIYQEEQIGRKLQVFGRKSVKVLNQSGLKNRIVSVLHKFQQSICQEQQSQIAEIETLLPTSQKDFNVFRYVEYASNSGKFYFLRYRSNINSIDVFVQNTYNTFCVGGKAKAKGNSIYSPNSFIKDFAIGMKTAGKVIGLFCSIIYRKFQLKVFTQPLQEEEQDLYSENALTQLTVTSKFFRRKYLPFEDYLIPVTIQIIAINNQAPVGIRIIAYDPATLHQMGHFISVTPASWEKPIQEDKQGNRTMLQQEGNQEHIKRSIQDYNFKKAYFLAQWMELKGFELIYSLIGINNRALQLRGLVGRISRIQQILDLM